MKQTPKQTFTHTQYYTQNRHIKKIKLTILAYATSATEVATSALSAAGSIAIVFATWFVLAPIFAAMLGLETGRQDLGEFGDEDYGSYYNYQYTQPAGQYGDYYQGRSFASRSGILPRVAKKLFNRYFIVHATEALDEEQLVCRSKNS